MWQQQTGAGDFNSGEFRSICQEVIAAVADYHADLSGRGVRPDFAPDDVRALFAEELSDEVAADGTLLADWRERIAPRLTATVGLREHSSKNLDLALYLHNLVREHPDFEVLHEPALYLYCFRYVPNSLAERWDEPEIQTLLDRLNREIVEAVRRGGHALLTTTRIRNRVAIRLMVCSHKTPEVEIDATFEATARWGRLLTRSHSFCYETPTEMEAM